MLPLWEVGRDMIGDALGVDSEDTEAARRGPNRWFTGRAMLLHSATIAVVAGCVAAAWWQASRAMAGNGLSWFYTFEWPAFGLIALWGWWHLIHEDPEEYRARTQGTHEELPGLAAGASHDGAAKTLTVDRGTARLAGALAVAVAVDSALGVALIVLVPLGRPTSLIPARAPLVYPLHAALGALLFVGAVVLVKRVRGAGRLARLSGVLGGIGTASAAAGGLCTASHPLRFAGMAVMLLGTVIAAFGYSIPAIERLS
ncbi:MAG: hypothetical protein KGQ66_09165 [Acidobacteriota bacterium]|nr:hypothetical protein [Acidobacteriota bacterium]